MKTTRKRFLLLTSFVGITVVFWNFVLLSYNKSHCMSPSCEASISEERDEETIHKPWHRMQIQSTTPSKRAKEFVYLVQTKQCLPAKLLKEQHIGDAEDCRCDVLVLSFKTPCEEKNRSSFSHVEYISRPTNVNRISWAAGRNLLYSTAKARNYEYLYYIFMDDDLEFQYNKGRTPSSLRSMSPLRSFENFLLDYKPAIGVPNYVVHHDSDVMIQKIKNICKKGFNSSSVFVPVIHFDASMNAFHKDAVDHILPYPTKFDKTNWWHSQRFVIAATELKFRGQCYLYIPVNSLNTDHGDYPRNDGDANQVWSTIVRDLISTIPSEYARENWMKEFIEDPVKHTENSRAICWKFPLGFSIKPFGYFNLYQN